MTTDADGFENEERGTKSAEEKLEAAPERDRSAIDAGSRARASLIHEIIRADGESELRRPASALLLSGFAAGLSMGFSLIAGGVLLERGPEGPGWRMLVDLGYCFGFLVVVLGRQQLFTENTLTPILPLLYHRNAVVLGKVARLWGLVLAANIAATWAIAAVLAFAPAFTPEVKEAFAEISRHAIDKPFWTTLVKAVFAGWLIALMVWLLPAADTARPLIIVAVTFVVALGGFNHIVVGSVDTAFLVWRGEADLAAYLTAFFAPTLLGNVLGGVTLVAVLNYGQVAEELED